MKLTLEELFKIEHELLADNYSDADVVATITEFVDRILRKEEEMKENGR